MKLRPSTLIFEDPIRRSLNISSRRQPTQPIVSLN